MRNVKKWSNILQKSCGVNIARSLKCVWLIFNKLDQRNMANVPSQIVAFFAKELTECLPEIS